MASVAATLILSGPTATGKSELALELAERYDAALISADAMTVYREMDIGTAKPEPEVLSRHPHACVNVRDPDEDFSVADFVAAFDGLKMRHQRVIVVGGTPFYIAALLRPMAELPASEPAVRRQLEDLADPYAALLERDPSSARRLHPNDRMRIIRALEVHAISGEPLSVLHSRGSHRPPLEAPVVWLERQALRARIDQRIQLMLTQGYIAETEQLLARGWHPDLKPMKSFAHRHLVAHVQGHLDLDEAVRRTARDTWKLARKQRTWGRGMAWTPQNADQATVIARKLFDA